MAKGRDRWAVFPKPKLTPASIAEKKNEKIDMYNFLVHDCTQKQNSSPYFSSIVQQCKWPSLSRKIVET